MLVIRFARTGKRHQAYFRIVVSDKRKTPTAKFVEILGNYDPHAKKLSINEEKLKEYMKNGAVPSNSVAKLLKSEKIEMPKWVQITEKKKAKKEKKGAAAEAPKAAAPEKGTEAQEAPAEGEAAAAEAPAEDKKEESKEAPKGEEENKDNSPQAEEETPTEGVKEGE